MLLNLFDFYSVYFSLQKNMIVLNAKRLRRSDAKDFLLTKKVFICKNISLVIKSLRLRALASWRLVYKGNKVSVFF